MRKYLAAAVACLLALGLAACGRNGDANATEATQTGTSTITATITTMEETTTETSTEAIIETASATTTANSTTMRRASATARLGEVKLATVEEAIAFFAKKEYTMQVRRMGADEYLEPFRIVVKQDKTWNNSAFGVTGRPEAFLSTADMYYDLNTDRKEYVVRPREEDYYLSDPDWAKGEMILEEATVEEIDGKKYHQENFALVKSGATPDGGWIKQGWVARLGFADGDLRYIQEYDSCTITYEDGSVVCGDGGGPGLYIDYILDTADPALFSLEGYKEVTQLSP